MMRSALTLLYAFLVRLVRSNLRGPNRSAVIDVGFDGAKERSEQRLVRRLQERKGNVDVHASKFGNVSHFHN